MTIKALEQRLATLEAEMAELKRQVQRPVPRRDWRSTVGAFSGDDGMMEVFDEARKLREADRAKARRTSPARGRRS